MPSCPTNYRSDTRFKVAVIGCGNVGATAAYALLLDGVISDLVLIDKNKDKANGLRLDLEHSLSFLRFATITASDDYGACENADIIVITAGARQQEGETRLQLIDKNRKMFQEILPSLTKVAPEALFMIVTNPVDILTFETLRVTGLPGSRVFGTGTMLDTARFRFHIAEKLCLNPRSVDAYILGEHGDSSFPVLSSASIGGKPLLSFEGFSSEVAMECYEATKQAAYRIIHDMGYTCYSIGVVIRDLVRAIQQNARVVVPISVKLDNYYGHSGVALSVPCVIGRDGVSDILNIPLNSTEQEQLAKAVETLKAFIG